MGIEPLGVIELLWSMLEAVAKGFTTQKKEVFENHVEPLQVRMSAIHKDYIAGFEEVKRILKTHEKPTPELLEFLYERRRENEHERQLSNDLANNLAKLKKVGIRNDDMEAIKAYATAIAEYFSASGRIGGFSWYTDFIDIVQRNTRAGFHDVWFTTAISGNLDGELMGSANQILNQGLPNAFKKISSSYAYLRTRLF
ncbi:hypothetical protein [Nitrospira sp. BLG_1]|uniref:hypothetical protein n=1 Tax=Nitrospira sp. BLG_1 TaxID=3395883 RepID=UPI0039BD49DD